jgi:hypothetical protein
MPSPHKKNMLLKALIIAAPNWLTNPFDRAGQAEMRVALR